MTIINGIEIDHVRYSTNYIKEAINNNEPMEDKLNVIAVVSNPCLFAKRYILMKEFIHRLEKEETNVRLFIVELAYNDQSFIITDKNNKRHLQLRSDCPLWHKENMINLGVKYLLPKNYKAFAWIDADIEFENTTWALDTLKVLNGAKDIVQLFSHAVDMDNDEWAMNIFNSAGYLHTKGKPYCNKGINYYHPGFAWAITRKAFERIGGLYDKAILGSGDNIMMFSLLGNGIKAINENSTDDYKESILDFQEKIKTLRYGYIPGVIRHYFHGSKQNRKYHERWQILLDHEYSPNKHIKYSRNGLILPTDDFSSEFKSDIIQYFRERNEDEGLSACTS
jgi:hypothetical protein